MGREFSQEEIDAAKAKHGAIFCTELGGDQYWFRRPSPDEFYMFEKTISDPEMRHTAVRALVCDVIVLPERKAFLAELAEYPGITLPIGERVMDVATKGRGTEAKKAR